jgi:hypothetical protein
LRNRWVRKKARLRVIRRLLTVIGLVASLLLAFAGPGLASCDDDSDDPTGIEFLHIGPSGATQFYDWDQPQHNLTLFVRTEVLGSNHCLDSWFDWQSHNGPGGGHYDSRLVRNCRDHFTAQMRDAPLCHCNNGIMTEPAGWHGRPVQGISRGEADNWDTLQQVFENQAWVPQNLVNCHRNIQTAVLTSQMYERYWLFRANGTFDFNDAGLPEAFDN